MGWKWWRRPVAKPQPAEPDVSSEVRLLSVLMDGQAKAADQRTQIELKRQELELRRLELEFQHLEESSEQRRKDRAAAEEMRAKRREWTKNSRAAATHRRLTQTSLQLANGSCRVCINGGDPTLQANEILWHTNGHPGAAAS